MLCFQCPSLVLTGKEIGGVGLNRAIGIQRFRLLRLIGWWLVVLGLLCGLPISHDLMRRLCASLLCSLEEAEVAARCLLFAEACRIARKRGESLDLARLRHRSTALFANPSSDTDDMPSLATIRCRLRKLCRVLWNFAKYARRLLQEKRRSAAALPPLSATLPAVTESQCYPAVPWHPPEPPPPLS